MAEYCIRFVTEQSKLGLQGYIQLDIERANIMAILDRCKEHNNWSAVLDLAFAARTYLSRRGSKTEQRIAIDAGLAAASALKNRRAEGDLRGALGQVYKRMNELQHATECFEQALAIARENGDRHSEGYWLGELAFAIFLESGQEKRRQLAVKYLKQALKIARDSSDRHNEIRHLNALGIIYRDAGNINQAIGVFEKAVTIARAIGDRGREENLSGSLGLARDKLGQKEQGISDLEQALRMAQENGDKNSEWLWISHLRRIQRELGQLERVMKYYEQALASARAIGDRYSEATNLYEMGKLYKILGNISSARENLQQSLHIHEEINSPHIEGTRKSLSELDATGLETDE
jgi:tetratricopeptide (TPR) repeat protein